MKFNVCILYIHRTSKCLRHINLHAYASKFYFSSKASPSKSNVFIKFNDFLLCEWIAIHFCDFQANERAV